MSELINEHYRIAQITDIARMNSTIRAYLSLLEYVSKDYDRYWNVYNQRILVIACVKYAIIHDDMRPISIESCLSRFDQNVLNEIMLNLVVLYSNESLLRKQLLHLI